MEKFKILKSEFKGKIVESEEKLCRFGQNDSMKIGICFDIPFGKFTMSKYNSKGELNYERIIC